MAPVDVCRGKGQLKLQFGKGVPVTFGLREKAKGSDFAFDHFGGLTHK
jgi:hypothetical protein